MSNKGAKNEGTNPVKDDIKPEQAGSRCAGAGAGGYGYGVAGGGTCAGAGVGAGASASCGTNKTQNLRGSSTVCNWSTSSGQQ